MKKNKLKSLLMAAVMTISIIPAQVVTNASESDIVKDQYKYFHETWEDSGVVWIGKKIKSDGMIDFIDGQAMGITDSTDILWNETVALDGIYARKQYNKNSSYFTVNDKFYEEGDTEFLFSIVYYDFGPSEGSYFLEYHATDGTEKQVKFIKPGRNPGWDVKTAVLDDVDFTKKYENGATFRIVNGAYNAFKKVEVINISKAKRENKPINATTLGCEIRREVETVKIVSMDDPRFTNIELAKACTEYDAFSMRNTLTTGDPGKFPESAKENKMTQGELLKSFMEILDIDKNEGESYIDAAKRYGLIDSMHFFYGDDMPAIKYHLLKLSYSALLFENPKGKILAKELIKLGYYDNVNIESMKSDKFADIYFRPDNDGGPISLPYETVTDHATGRQFKFISFFGGTLLTSYVGSNCWLPDGSGFVCGTPSGFIYLYDIKSQTLTYLDQAIGNGSMTSTTVPLDGNVYYSKYNDDSTQAMWRINPRTLEKEKLYSLPKGLSFGIFHVTNDGRYCEIYDNKDVLEKPEGTVAIGRVDFVEKKIEYTTYKPSHANYNVGGLNHYQINPEYPELVGFSHDYGDPEFPSPQHLYDRVNVINVLTGDHFYFNSGRWDNGLAVQLNTHEVWSYDGEHRYFCSWAADGSKGYSGEIGGVVRMDKDGTHRQYFKVPYGCNHAGISGDERVLVADEQWITLISTETLQQFPITNGRARTGTLGHPYHPHPHVSYEGNMANWGHVHRGVLGIAFIDYTDILENEVAKGGRYQFGDDVEYVSYKNHKSEAKVIEKAGKECLSWKAGNSLYLDINEDIIDEVDGAVKLTFDYYDNTNKPLTLYYTKGVENVNDAWKVYRDSVEIYRKDTNKWKTAEIVIDCGNFEDIGTHESDIRIDNVAMAAYITNIRVEKIDHK